MSEKHLAHHDAVLAVTQSAINKGFARLFRPGAFEQAMDIDIDTKYGHKVTGRMGVPTLRFLPGNATSVKLLIPFEDGEFSQGKVWNNETQQLEDITTPLAGSSLGFVVDLKRLTDRNFRDAKFTIEAIYLDLTAMKNIDTDNFGVDLSLLGAPERLFEALTKFIRARTYAGSGAASDQLFLGGVVVPVVMDAQGPMRAHEAAYSATAVQRQKDVQGELNFLLMMGGRPLPKDVRAGVFNEPWTDEAASDVDATLVLSDYLLLDLFARPAIEKAFSGIGLTLTRGTTESSATLEQVGTFKVDNKITVSRLVAAVNTDGLIQIDLTAVSSERLQVEQSNKALPDVDFSLVDIRASKAARIFLKVTQKETGEITCSSREDEELKAAAPTKEVKWNGQVDRAQDIVKWITGVGLALIPGLGPFLEGIMIGAQTIATSVLVEVDNRNQLEAVGLKIRSALTELNESLELPGNYVLKFSALRIDGAVAKFDATYVERPALREAQIEPYALAPYPRLVPGESQSVATTPRQLVGEVLLPYKYVNDPAYEGAARSKIPYYILRREQNWERVGHRRFSGAEETTSTYEITVVNTAKSTASIENTTLMKVSTKGTVKLFEAFAPEISAEISNTLKVTNTTETSSSTTEKQTIIKKRAASPQPYTVSAWLAADHYSVVRPGSPETVIACTTVYDEDYLQEDLARDPVPAPAPKTAAAGAPAGS